MNPLDKLISQFERFPGVGARQAKRFAFHILTLDKNDTDELARLISELKGNVIECQSCHRFFVSKRGNLCTICNSANRDRSRLLIVERDPDVQVIERAGVYNGLYFVLGGTVPLISTSEANKVRGGALKTTITTALEHDLREIILGFSVNPDGENTARYVESILNPLIKDTTVKLSYLGRGLSTGSELEYADPETIKNALLNRS